MRIVFGGGGTGGHLFPALALAREFEKKVPGCSVLFIGTRRGIESRILPGEGFDLRFIPAAGMVGVRGFKKLGSLLKLPLGFGKSLSLLRGFKPDLVIGVGGYSSGPVLAASWVLRIPRVLVEPNSIPGLTNRILGPVSHRVYLAFEGAAAFFKRGSGGKGIRVFGNPIGRDVVVSGEKPAGPNGSKEKSLTLLIMGGSQGASSINKAVCDGLSELGAVKRQLKIIHQTGDRDLPWVKEAYGKSGIDAKVSAFLKPVAEAYREADLVISRAGATTVAELTACGRPAVLIPFPHATHGHQEKNAKAMEAAGAAVLLDEKELSGRRLVETITEIIEKPGGLHTMARESRKLGRPGAAEEIVDDCLKLIGGETERGLK